jgi:hypothetical protein
LGTSVLHKDTHTNVTVLLLHKEHDKSGLRTCRQQGVQIDRSIKANRSGNEKNAVAMLSCSHVRDFRGTLFGKTMQQPSLIFSA